MDNYYKVGEIEFSLSRNEIIPSTNKNDIGMSALTNGKPSLYYEAWAGTNPSPSSNPAGYMLIGDFGLLFLSEGSRKKKSSGLITRAIGFNMLGIAGFLIGDAIAESAGNKLDQTRFDSIDNPASFAISYNEIIRAKLVKSKKGLKNIVTAQITCERPDGITTTYYVTSTLGTTYDAFITKLSRGRLFYESTCLLQSYEADVALQHIQYFSEIPWLREYLVDANSLTQFMQNPMLR